MQKETQRFLDALEQRHGANPLVRRRVAPVVRRIFETDTPARRALLDAVTVVYGYHATAFTLLADMQADDEQRFAA